MLDELATGTPSPLTTGPAFRRPEVRELWRGLPEPLAPLPFIAPDEAGPRTVTL